MLLLAERLLQALLHVGKLALGDADLVRAVFRRDDAAGIVRRPREGEHRTRHRPDRPDHDAVDGGIDQGGGEERKHQRQQRDVARIDEHRGAKPLVGDDELELGGALADLAEDAQHSLAAEEQRVERTRHGGHGSGAGKVDMLVDLGRHLGDDEQPRDAAVAHGDRLGADRHQHVVLQRPRQAFGILLHEHDRDRCRRAQPFLQPAQLEIGDRGQEDQHFRDHDEEHGEHEQLDRQAARQRHRPGRDLVGGFGGGLGNSLAHARRILGRGGRLPQPKSCIRRTMPRISGLRASSTK